MFARFGTLLGLLVAICCVSDHASAQIRSPGNHPRYGLELEPHLVVQWTNEPVWDDEGIGVGLRASIPVVDNGPVQSINNSLAVGFGLDWAHFDGCGAFNDQCDVNDFWIPLVVQWNFWITRSISLFPEIGLALQYSVLDWDNRVPPGCQRVNGLNICNDDVDDLDVEFVLWLGARFMVSNNIGITLRLGVPSLLLGLSILM